MNQIIVFIIVVLLVLFLLLFLVVVKAQFGGDSSEAPSQPREDRTLDQYLPKDSTFEIKGIWYRSPSEQMRAWQLKMKESVFLVAEPENTEDKDAIKIMTADNVHIGYMPRELAHRYASKMDRFREATVEVNEPDGNTPLIIVCAKFDI